MKESKMDNYYLKKAEAKEKKDNPEETIVYIVGIDIPSVINWSFSGHTGVPVNDYWIPLPSIIHFSST